VVSWHALRCSSSSWSTDKPLPNSCTAGVVVREPAQAACSHSYGWQQLQLPYPAANSWRVRVVVLGCGDLACKRAVRCLMWLCTCCVNCNQCMPYIGGSATTACCDVVLALSFFSADWNHAQVNLPLWFYPHVGVMYYDRVRGRLPAWASRVCWFERV
jgi:hypothetical protein